MFLIIGLGNPGLKYKKTRHNAGFQAVNFLIGKEKWTKDKKTNSKIIKTEKYIVAKPQTFMNNSGQAVRSLMDYYKIKNIIIIYDELDLSFGEIRVRDKGSSAGHNGIKSIIEHLGTENFWRIRVGIANEYKEKMPADKFVLKKFSRIEQKELQNKILPDVISRIEEIV
ncbi:aminoacyl-tRNA hydrolase [Candidatus Parcubacteria bacterium]|nr:aminoacyl-tRNA hydrolase [Patescibacteria group bacterium]MBU4482054.1 aminoacyl-tRNA hydrolase [Patescibacteria group bacterium]MCG2687120.1 aminoacyl-tRNA hydrolase [Candidatus Parcubacteria bacterium]